MPNPIALIHTLRALGGGSVVCHRRGLALLSACVPPAAAVYCLLSTLLSNAHTVVGPPLSTSIISHAPSGPLFPALLCLVLRDRYRVPHLPVQDTCCPCLLSPPSPHQLHPHVVCQSRRKLQLQLLPPPLVQERVRARLESILQGLLHK
ncbi:hypothetical protein F5Y03DRAFT_346779 [Xylaria venustula]|nr:hypothetical protein F5Y03DRAFT_346779 [Xylaria venustula]